MQQTTCFSCGYPHLRYHQCKIRCPNCGFMLDCSDLDVGGEVQRAQRSRPRPDERKPPPSPSE